MRASAEHFAPSFRKLLEARYLTTRGARAILSDLLTKGSSYALSEPAKHLYHTLHKEHVPMHEAIGSMIGTILPLVGKIAHQSALLLDLFLQPKYSYAKDRLAQLAQRNDEEAMKEFEMWIWEGMRICPAVPGAVREANVDIVVQDGDRKLEIKSGDRIIIATSVAHLDPNVFPNPERLDPSRPKKVYLHLGADMHFCFGARLIAPSIMTMLHQVFKLPNLRRAQGQPGMLITVHDQLGHARDACGFSKYLDAHCRESLVPTSMMIEYGV